MPTKVVEDCAQNADIVKSSKKHHCICASSIASERILSKGGSIVTAKRNGFKPEYVESLMYHVFQFSHLSLFCMHSIVNLSFSLFLLEKYLVKQRNSWL